MTARILDKNFKYTPAAATDIRKTFARIRRQLAATQGIDTGVNPNSQPAIVPTPPAVAAPTQINAAPQEHVAKAVAYGSDGTAPAVAAPNVRQMKRAAR